MRRRSLRLVSAVFALAFATLSVGPMRDTGGARARRQTPLVKFQVMPARLARGRYLVNNVAHCFMCHADIDCLHNNCQPVPGTQGSGQVLPAWESGFPAPYQLVEPNITPDRKTGAGAWTDEQFVRALREGIGHDGRRLFPAMPYANFRGLSDEDLASIVVYIRSLPPVRRALPKSRIPPEFPVSAYASLEPPLPPVPVNASSEVRHGAYLVRLGNCSACHTTTDADGRWFPGMFLAGGQDYAAPWGTFASANITPDPSGISWYTEDLFLKTIRTGREAGTGRKLNQFMPWSYFRNQTDGDLKAIFAYLRTLKPVRHHVDNTEPPTYCCIDKSKHGLGYTNCPPYVSR